MGESVRYWVRGPRQVVVPWDIPVKALMDTKQAQEVRRYFVYRGTPSSLPEERVQVVGLAEDRALANVKGLDKGL